jgi:DNA-binding transcriptional MerR regulator
MATSDKDPGAFRTIGELSEELGVAQHILRYWETKFPQLKPLQRAGNRRYYRPADVDLARRIHRLLSQEGYTIRGAQKALKQPDDAAPIASAPVPAPAASAPQPEMAAEPSLMPSGLDYERLVTLRDKLVAALAD